MFRTVRLSIIGSLSTVHLTMVYVIQVCRQLSNHDGTQFHPGPARKLFLCPSPGWNAFPPCWWADELPETCRVAWQNKFVKLVHLVGFITKKLWVWFSWHMLQRGQQMEAALRILGQPMWLIYVALSKLLQRPDVIEEFEVKYNRKCVWRLYQDWSA
jgi:hypothetical protein